MVINRRIFPHVFRDDRQYYFFAFFISGNKENGPKALIPRDHDQWIIENYLLNLLPSVLS